MERVSPETFQRRSVRAKRMLLSVLYAAFLFGSVPRIGSAETSNNAPPPPGRRPPAGGSHGSRQQDENNNRQVMQHRQDGVLSGLGNAIQAVAPLAVLGGLAAGGNQNSVQPTPKVQPTPVVLRPGPLQGAPQVAAAGSAGSGIESF